MSPIAVSRQAQTGLNGDNADAQGSGSSLPGVAKEKGAGLERWKSLTRMFEAKKGSSPALRQTSLAINVDAANDVPCDDDIDNLTDWDVTRSLAYSPEELAALVTSGGRPKRWAFCLTPTPEPQAEDDRDDKGDRTEPGEEADRPQTLYLILDPGQVPSSASEVVMLVGTMEELRGRTGGGDEDEKGL